MSDLDHKTDQEILKILAANAPIHVMDIAKRIDHHPITVDQTCARLHERGHIYPAGRGLYDLTDEGKQQLEGISDS